MPSATSRRPARRRDTARRRLDQHPRESTRRQGNLWRSAARGPLELLPGGGHKPGPRRVGGWPDLPSRRPPDGGRWFRPGRTGSPRTAGAGTGHCPEHEHFADTIEAEKELGEESLERRAALFYAPVGDGISGAFRSGDAGKPQLPQIAGKRCLGDIPSPLEQKLPEIFLAAHHPGVDDLQDRVVAFALVGHCGEFSTEADGARAATRIID